jgi:clan AA aspartic protease (TIGR02281 family)
VIINQANSSKSKLNGIAVTAFCAALTIMFCVTKGDAGVYSYKDEHGKTHYTDDLSKIPLEYREAEKGVRKLRDALKDPGPITVPTVASPSLTTPIEVPARIANANEFHIPLTAKGNSYYLDVILNGGVTASLLLDTGASKVVLSKEVAGKLGFNFDNVNAKQTSSTANGDAIFAVVVLQSVVVGNAKSIWVEALFNDKYEDDDGLLGMSFLGDFRFEIDRSKKILILKPLSEGEIEWGGKPGSWWKNKFNSVNENLKEYSRAWKSWRRRGKTHAAEYKYMTDYYVDLKKRLENQAKVAGVPEKFR